ncbi:hypothetical protein CONLIGDRAFT_584273 [Coniochaeta ligniaria NRRL 30616]|uniref:Uncharacterized protein n=1 Tax=Coniochaeta ligniaria NRRL 30616 TaxID=1408157 RepID=A0A1J7I9P5_9PEZI|nr:hypothetical protein CONLIGDRAFT_584273 [Coniochaeta ligniaria NRRL 30616]
MPKSPLSKTRSLSDGGGTPGRLSPSPHIVEASRRQSKDDNFVRDGSAASLVASLPSTPIRAGFALRGLSLQLPQEETRETNLPAQTQPYVKPAPLSPKLDHSHIYASPNILPRRSRGLDFSRAATSLHHSTLADQGSPDSSPTVGSRAMNIPGRRSGDYGNAEQSSNSLWTVMGHHHERSNVSSSLGSTMHMCSDSSSTSEDDDFMDEDMMEDGFITTPHVNKTTPNLHPTAGAPWMPGGSPAVNSLLSFQQRQRPRKQPRKKLRGPLGLGFSSVIPQPGLSKSPPNNAVPKDLADHSRRESISWAANQLHISGSESDDSRQAQIDGSVDSPSRPGVIKRAVTRRGSLLPKTKGFARIRAALAEESAPVEAEFRHEAEVVRQVRESDLEYPSTLSSPNLAADNLDDIPEDAMMMDPGAPGLGLSASFKQQALKNSRGKDFWDTFSETSGSGRRGGGPPRITPPPPLFGLLARGSSAGLSGADDINMDSPSAASSNGGGTRDPANPFAVPGPVTAGSSSGNDTPGQQAAAAASASASTAPGYVPAATVGMPPSAAEITRRINNKRRRDDDFDPVSFKRRAVSPGMSVHNSPIMQSPLQRDVAPWGSRPGSVGGDTTGKSGAPSDSGSQGSRPGGAGGKGRVGLQGMMDTNDGITKLSIE